MINKTISQFIINGFKKLIVKVKNVKRKPISIILFISVIAMYQATYLNSAYFSSVLKQLTFASYKDVIFFLTMPLVIFFVIFSLLNLLIFPKLIKVIAAILLTISMLVNYFSSTYGIMLDRDMLQNVLETNTQESLALITPKFIIQFILFALIPVLVIILTKLKPIKNKVKYLLSRIAFIGFSVSGILIIATFYYGDYAAFTRNNSGIVKYITPSNYIAAVYNEYDYLKYKNMPFIEIGTDAYQEKRSVDNGKPMVTILVLGETSRAQNFSLGGYAKETNAMLQNQDVTYFENTSSCGTFTAHSVPCMFSNMTREKYDGRIAQNRSNALDILQNTGVDVLWLENDDGCKGVCARVPTIDVTKKYENDPKFCQDGSCYDEVLLQDLPHYLDNVKKDTFIVLHTIGSHGPSYYERIPNAHRKFSPSCDTNEINHCTKEEITNTYDNTVAYADSMVSQTIDTLKKYNARYNTSLIYVSDHGESLGENNIYLHGMPYSIAPKEQTHIPLLVWMSSDFQREQEVNGSCLKKIAKKESVSHDNLFHSLLGMYNIKTKEYDASLDLFNACSTMSS